MHKSLDRSRTVTCQARHTLLTDVLDKTIPKEVRKPEQQSSISTERWGDREKQIFSILFSFSAYLT